jgi:hypothetical protein
MANQTYTTGTDRTTYVDRHDNKLVRMILPFIVGLVLGYGAGELGDRADNDRVDAPGMQSGSVNTPQ